MIVTLKIDIIDLILIVVTIITFFFKQIKKKGDKSNKFPKLDSLVKITLVIGKNNNVNNNVNIKK